MRMGVTEFSTPIAVAAPAVTGICAGTTIMTLAGEMPIEHLRPGDKVITRDSGVTVVTAIHTTSAKVAPVRIKAGSLGHQRPDRDMMVTPGARIHVRDWRAEALFGKPAAQVAAARLVDGEFVALQPLCDMTLYEVIFDREHIIYADGVEMIVGE